MKRRDFLKHGTGAVAAAGALGVPALLRAQDVIKVGHMTPRTGFLGQLGA
ncbi:MAG TPA: twin-arginine translocation signal domain-containing protein, partial [Candidatus Polarisedimenticolia bacterium]|nr:twin-arginine translocation signal domain-containing protein [Candidatus Polarisedimenticolia bacterium]